MIVVYPMICSGTIAESTLPAIVKTVERYLIVYYMNDIVKDINENKELVGARNFKINSGKLFLEWGFNPAPGTSNKGPTPPPPPPPLTTLNTRTPRGPAGTTNVQVNIQQKDAKKEASKLDMKVSENTIDISPTYVQASTPAGPAFIGIKVVAIRVKSDADLTYYLEADQNLNILMATAVNVGRGALRKIYSVYDRFIGSKIGSLTPTGDARHDVIYGRSGFSIKGITLVDKNQLSEDFIKSPKHINRMHSLGWSNIILADDINRYAYFCMQKFRGICNSIPYQMMYRSLGHDQVYESIEETRVKNSSLFKVGPSFRKLVGESLALRKRDHYLWSENDSFLAEMDLTGFMNKITPSKFKSLGSEIKEKSDAGNYRGIFNTLHSLGLNEEHVDASYEKGKEINNELEDTEEMVRKVMKNSLPHETMKNVKLVDKVAKSIAFAASLTSKKHGNSTKKAAKSILEDFIPKVRSFYEEQKEEEESPKKSKRPKAAIYHTMEAAIGIIWIGFWGGLIAGGYILVYTHMWAFIGLLAATVAIIGLLKLASATSPATPTATIIVR
jgi:hypothetical protein